MAATSKYFLGDLIEIKHGYAFKGKYFSDSGSHIVLTPGNFFEEGGFKIKDQEKWYTGDIPNEYILEKGALLVAMTEQAEGLLGSSAIVPEDNLYLHNQRLGLVQIIDESKLDEQYLYYLFNTYDVRGQIKSTASGTKVRHTSPSRIYEAEVDIPKLEVQKKIASILSAFDDLIENNTRRIEILEEMARHIYREWFVHFRYPGHERDRLVDSGTELGKIPEEWKIEKVDDVIETLGGGTPRRKNDEYWDNGTITWYTPSDLTAEDSMFMDQSSEKINELGLKKSSAKVFPAHSVMMTSRATIGVISINTTQACTNQGFITCIPNEYLNKYQIYFWLHEQKPLIEKLASGATYKEINKSTFRDLDVVVPPEDLSYSFFELVDPLGKQIQNLLRNNKKLKETRDLLLPKLISGKIDVSNDY